MQSVNSFGPASVLIISKVNRFDEEFTVQINKAMFGNTVPQNTAFDLI